MTVRTYYRPAFGTGYTGLVGNSTREQTAEFLAAAYSEGYLTAAQHDTRTGTALKAENVAGINEAVAGLPRAVEVKTAAAPEPKYAAPAGLQVMRGMTLMCASSFFTLLGIVHSIQPGAGTDALIVVGVVSLCLTLITLLAGDDCRQTAKKG